jgi:hypothetical protein
LPSLFLLVPNLLVVPNFFAESEAVSGFGPIQAPGLVDLNVFSLPTLGALGHVELDALAFLEGPKTGGLDGGVMDEDVLAVFTAQKPKTFCVIEPLDCALFHCVAPHTY